MSERAVATLPPVPEPGQVVNVRGATWAVTEIQAQGSPRALAGEDKAGLAHVVRLQSLEEDRLGYELAIVWELEAGHTLAPDQGLPETISPDRFDDPNTLAAFVDAVRWGAVTSADDRAFQAPFCGRQQPDEGHPGASREMRAQAISVRHPAQRVLRIVHRAAGDDRRP